MLDYESLKAMAKGIGRPVKNLLALAPVNDPFYAGVGFRRRNAEWFAAIWADHGATGSHLRRLHYQLISSTAPILKPDGSAYQNTDDDWEGLVTASLAARYLDLVPFDCLVDRRNDEPMIFAENLDADPDRKIELSCGVDGDQPSVEMPDIPDMPELPFLISLRQLPRAEVHRRGLDREEHTERLARAAVPAPRRQPRDRHR